ncbi:MAG: methylated-DNA--[protein]-cysteine S-methyltransferase [Methanobacteriota archaeon]
MTERLSLASYKSPVGRLNLAATPRGLARLNFGDEKAFEADVANALGPAEWNEKALAPVIDELAEYFAGRRKRFDATLDVREGTAFERGVWRELSTIPYGETRSYGWIAERIGSPKAVRAVGRANGKNPIAIVVPCHRVVAADGGLGGYSCGLEPKEKLLALEGVAKEQGRGWLTGPKGSP